VKIRHASIGDVASMMSLEHDCPSAAHWTERQYRDLFAAGSGPVRKLALVAGNIGDPSDETGLFGFLVARHLAPEWELENVVVAPAARRMGIGKGLLEGLLAEAANTYSESVFLEVRESNHAARGLYESLGFRETGRRKSYYNSPLEDAVLYSLILR
jgi:[ribosomal protein S18]-alanine N-acetyltransferase